jgi:formamidopyrimidine-DNA glycosylase
VPELPEVETFVRRLRPAVGSTIESVVVVDGKLRLDGEALVGARIASIERRGKNIVFDLDRTGRLVIHLRMSGRLRLERTETEIPYTRLILGLDSGRSIFFVNPRRLGTAVLWKDGFGADLGPDPLDASLTADAFAESVSASRAPIKTFLMDQRRIAGVGNIYAAESLWRAGIAPQRPANSLTCDEARALRESLVAVLTEAIDRLGTTLGSGVSDYRPSLAEAGTFQNRLLVYGREGEGCTRCGTPIERVVHGGRSTYQCPNCQR